MSNKSKHFLLQACKIVVILSCVCYLGWQFKARDFKWISIGNLLTELPFSLYIALPVLSMLSWFIESYKWQLLVQDLKELRFRESIIHNLTAQAASFITPLKAGEFATKILYFPSDLRNKVFKAVFVGNLSQMAVTFFLGIAGIALLERWEFTAAAIFLGSIAFIVLSSKPTAHWLHYSGQRIDAVVGISLLRYILFSSCWLLVLLAISDASLLMIVGSVTAMYLAVSVIPSMQIFDVFLKWSVATFFVGYLGISIENMLTLVAIIWINNTVFPVVLGCVLLAFQRFPKVIPA